jgi:DNA-binding response OmpR family regulator
MKILVVDDERDIQALFEQRFRREIREGEMLFSFAFSGEEALQYLVGLRQEADYVLSDINMPGMNGLQLLKHLKDHFRQSKPAVVMITAYGDNENYNQAMKLGADDFFTKPLNFGELKDKLKIQPLEG